MMEELKIYISQPTSGLSAHEMQKRKESAKKELSAILGKEIFIIEPFLEIMTPPSNISGNKIRLWYFMKSLEKMLEADMIVFLNGYTTSMACIIEEMICQLYQLKCHYLV